jgi:hypothetical protein
MRVRMTTDVQGFSTDSRGERFYWPGRGREIDLEDATAHDLIRAGQAVPVSTFRSAETATPDASDVEERTGIGTAAHTFARPSGAPATEHFDTSADDEVAVRDEASVQVTENESEEGDESGPSQEAPRRGRPRKYTRGDL